MPGTSRTRDRILIRIGGAVAALAVVGLVRIRTRSPIGHWNSERARDRYVAAYQAAFAALPEPDRQLDVRTNYGVVRVYRFKGTGSHDRPLILLPGRASATPVWAANLPSLLALADVYAMDLLGEPGLSVQSRPIASDADHGRWLTQVLAALPEDGFDVVGMSIGGWTAVNLALHHPVKIASLILIEPVQVFADMPLETILRSIPAALPITPKAWRDSFNSYTAGGAPVGDEAVAHLIEAGMAGYTLRLSAPTRISAARLRSIRIPTLVFLAGRSVMHSGAGARTVAERALPHVSVRFYPNASHAINGEYPDEIARDLEDFLARPEALWRDDMDQSDPAAARHGR